MPIQSVSVCNLKIESRLTNLDLFHNRAKDLTDPIPIHNWMGNTRPTNSNFESCCLTILRAQRTCRRMSTKDIQYTISMKKHSTYYAQYIDTQTVGQHRKDWHRSSSTEWVEQMSYHDHPKHIKDNRIHSRISTQTGHRTSRLNRMAQLNGVALLPHRTASELN